MSFSLRDERQPGKNAISESPAVDAFVRLLDAQKRGNVRASRDAIRELRGHGWSIVPVLPKVGGFGK